MGEAGLGWHGPDFICFTYWASQVRFNMAEGFYSQKELEDCWLIFLKDPCLLSVECYEVFTSALPVF